ncbi:MAG: carboxy terminal-processing peptidase [Planctomycetaceae bacterium]
MRFRNPTRVAALLTTGMLITIACAFGAQQFRGEAKSNEGQTASIVADMVTRNHISHAAIDDEVSKRLLDRFIESLDPQKLYFMKDDIVAMKTKETELDDAVKQGDVEFAFAAFKQYRRRMAQRMQAISKIIDQDHDFSVEEEMLVDSDDRGWATSDAEMNERWRKRVKYELLSMKLDDKELAEARTRLHKRYATLQNLMNQTEPMEILEIYLSSLTHTLDPHSSYMSPDTLDDFRIQMELKLEGIGASLRSEDGYTIVADVVDGGAADADGRLKVDDKIIAVDSKASGQWDDIIDMKLKHVVRKIRGNKGTKVRLQVKTETGEVKVYELTRQEIKLAESEVKGEVINAGTRLDGRTGRIGVINIPSFYRDFRAAQLGLDFKSTRKDVVKVLKQFEAAGGVDAVIVDLRFNGGGALSEAIEVSGLFIQEGPIVQVQEQDGSVTRHPDDDPDIQCREPLIVLTNRLSASASEIFAGAIKDYNRGIVVGDSTTHGKGTVQNVMNVTQGMGGIFRRSRSYGALKLTINQFYRVNGDSTQNRGVTSDIVLPSFMEHRDIGESTLDNALAFSQIEPAAHRDTSGYLTPQILSSLKQRSAARVSADKEFQILSRNIAKYKERKNRKTVSLNEEIMKKELEEAKAEAEEAKKELEEQVGTAKKDEIFGKNYYNDEVLGITLDYLDLWKQQRTVAR